MTPEKVSRLMHLRRLKADIENRIAFELRNQGAWGTLIKQSQRLVTNLSGELQTFEVELLDLQSTSDYEKDVNAEESSNPSLTIKNSNQ